MIPVDPRMAAMSYAQTSGSTPQSSARRYWQNRFRMGGARVYSSRMEMAKQETTGVGNMTGPGGVPQASMMPMAPIAPFRPTYGAPTDLMGQNRYLPGVGPNPAAEAAMPATTAPTMGRVGNNPLFENTDMGRWYDSVKRGDIPEGGANV